MSLIRLNRILFEKSSVTFRKQHEYTYASASSGETYEGSIKVASRPSDRVRGDTKAFNPQNSEELSTYFETQNKSMSAFLAKSENGYGEYDANDPYYLVSLSSLTVTQAQALGLDFLIDGNGNITSPLFGSLENTLVGNAGKSYRNTKNLYISASIGCYGADIVSRPPVREANQTYQDVWPGRIIIDEASNVATKNQPYKLINDIVKSDLEHDMDAQIAQQVMTYEYAIDGGIPANSNIVFDFRDQFNEFNQAGISATHGRARNLIRNNLAKKHITNALMPNYAAKYNNCDFSYSNYNTLNFLNTGDYPDDACLVYSASFFPKYKSSDNNFKDFTFSFWINPRYTNDTPGGDYKAGTIMHISSSIAVSLVSGSSTDANGYVDGYRIMLQLSQSAESTPSSISLTSAETSPFGNAGLSYPNDLVFVTPDNSLKKNHWHYVSVKWSPDAHNSTGSIRVDDNITHFPLPSSSLGDSNSLTYKDKMFIGNFYDGVGSEIPKFFSIENAALDSAPFETSVDNDAAPNFNTNGSHPLNAEIHELRGYAKRLTNYRETQVKDTGLAQYTFDEVKFHVPVSFSRFIRGGNNYFPRSNFVERTNPLLLAPQVFLSNGTTQISPFLTASVATQDTKFYPQNEATINSTGMTSTEIQENNIFFGMSSPFNPNFSMGQGGKYLNLPNFVKNFAATDDIPDNSGAYFPMSVNGYESPRLYNLSGSLARLPHTAGRNETVISTNTHDYCYSETGIKKRNLMILPNDNGLYQPNYFYLKKEEDGQKRQSHRYKSDNNVTDYSIISLRNIVQSGSENNLYFDSTRRNFLISYLTQDDDSNDVSIFSVPSAYYGEKIHPGTLEISDTKVTGSNEKISLKFKDDLRGSLYRADSVTPHAKWASVGNVFYDEGIVLIKSPHPPCFGKDNHTLKFKGEHTAQVLTINVPAPRDMINSSSNPNFLPVSASLLEQDVGNDLVYITGVNIHDENLNVIMRANLAQPVVKRLTDEYMFKIKMDF